MVRIGKYIITLKTKNSYKSYHLLYKTFQHHLFDVLTMHSFMR